MSVQRDRINQARINAGLTPLPENQARINAGLTPLPETYTLRVMHDGAPLTEMQFHSL